MCSVFTLKKSFGDDSVWCVRRIEGWKKSGEVFNLGCLEELMSSRAASEH